MFVSVKEVSIAIALSSASYIPKNERQGLAFFAPFELSALQIGVQRVEKSGSHEPPLTLVFRNVP